MGLAIAGLIVIVAFVLAYLSFKTWRITQVIVVVLICFGAAFNFYLAVMTLKVHDAWRKRVAADMEEVAKLEKEYAVLLNGEEEQGQQLALGINQVQDELYRLALDRGGTYFNVDLAKPVDPQSGAVTVNIAKPTPHSLVPKQVVFIFDEALMQEGGRYIGEFKVVATPDMSTEVELAPNLPFSATELQTAAASRGPWTIYLIMPLDSAAITAKINADVQAAVAARVPADFFKPDREMHDYEFAYHEYKEQTPLLREGNGRLQGDIQKTQTAQTKTQTEVTYREAEKASLQADLTQFKSERDAIAKYEQLLKNEVKPRDPDGTEGRLRIELRNVFFATKQLAEELTALQLRAAEEINRRTGVAAAPAAAGGAFAGQP